MAKSKFSIEKLKIIEKQIDEKSIVYDYRTKDYPFEVIVNKFGDEKDEKTSMYVPDYQREFVWNKKSQSRFIESVLLGVPLTPFFLSEDENSRLEIIDGSQRIRTLIFFYNNVFSLTGLKILTEINSAKFKDLPDYYQRKLKLRDFRVIIVNDKADLPTRKDIFNRINTSSEQLKDSEIRKGIHSGSFYDLVMVLAKDEKFINICPVGKNKAKRGEYEELILRFFAYTDSYKEAKHEVAAFLNTYLEKQNSTNFDKEAYTKRFTDVVKFIETYFPIGLRKSEKKRATPRVRFEAITVGVFLALQIKPDLTISNTDWLNSGGFKYQTTSDASNNPNRLVERVEFVRDALLGTIDDYRLEHGKNEK